MDYTPWHTPFSSIFSNGPVVELLTSSQVRSIQEAEGPEKIFVVFSSGIEPWKTKGQWQGSACKEKVCKVKMYVEAMEHDPRPRDSRMSWGDLR